MWALISVSSVNKLCVWHLLLYQHHFKELLLLSQTLLCQQPWSIWAVRNRKGKKKKKKENQRRKEADGKFVEDRKFINNVLKNFCHQIVFTSFALLSHFLKWWGEFSTNGLWRLSLSFKLGWNKLVWLQISGKYAIPLRCTCY